MLKKGIIIPVTMCICSSLFFGCGQIEDTTTPVDNTILFTENSKIQKSLMRDVIVENDIDKEETVYITASSTGEVEKIIVSDWLKNGKNQEVLKDSSNLSNIKNIKGNEKYQNQNQLLTWDAAGNDIFYQGESKEALPLETKITYKLDGKEVLPEDLVGKNGHVTIRFDYTNKLKSTVLIGDKEEEIVTPFFVASGLFLPMDQFSNITVTNGKVISDANQAIVIGFAIPGLQESLQLENEITIPDYIEITADVVDFSLGITITAFSSDIIGSLQLDKISESGQVEEIKNSINMLGDSMNQIVEGASSLRNGVTTMSEKMNQFEEGVSTLSTGIVAYTNGASSINQGVDQVSSGIGSLAAGASELTTGIYAAKQGADTLISGMTVGQDGNPSAVELASALTQGAVAVNAGVEELNASLASLTMAITGMQQSISAMKPAYESAMAADPKTEEDVKLIAGFESMCAIIGQLGTMNTTQVAALQAGTNSLVVGTQGLEGAMNSILAGTQQLQGGLGQLSVGGEQLKTGIGTLSSGVNELKSGTNTLIKNNSELITGVNKIKDGTTQLSTGIKEIEDGAIKLEDGTIKLNEEGIQKIVITFQDEILEMFDRLTIISESAANYNIFTQLAEQQTGSVKFILKTAEIQ